MKVLVGFLSFYEFLCIENRIIYDGDNFLNDFLMIKLNINYLFFFFGVFLREIDEMFLRIFIEIEIYRY